MQDGVSKKTGVPRQWWKQQGNTWLKMDEAFEKNADEVKLANPIETRVIAETRSKTDERYNLRLRAWGRGLDA